MIHQTTYMYIGRYRHQLYTILYTIVLNIAQLRYLKEENSTSKTLKFVSRMKSNHIQKLRKFLPITQMIPFELSKHLSFIGKKIE